MDQLFLVMRTTSGLQDLQSIPYQSVVVDDSSCCSNRPIVVAAFLAVTARGDLQRHFVRPPWRSDSDRLSRMRRSVPWLLFRLRPARRRGGSLARGGLGRRVYRRGGGRKGQKLWANQAIHRPATHTTIPCQTIFGWSWGHLRASYSTARAVRYCYHH